MSRYRNRLVHAPTFILADAGDEFHPQPTTWDHLFGYSVSESITDQIESIYPGCFGVTHNKNNASVVSNQSIDYYAPDGPRTMDVKLLAALWTGGFTPPSPDWQSLVSALGSSVSSRLQTNAQLWVTAAEFAKTVAMVKNPFNLLKVFSRASPVHNRMSFGALSKSASGKWLEYRYGWKPLKYDVENLIDSTYKYHGALQDAGTQHLEATRFSQSSSGSTSLPPTTSDAAWSYWLTYPNGSNYGAGVSRIVIDSVRYTHRVGCHRKPGYVTPSGFMSMMDQFMSAFGIGLDGQSLMDTVWELVPYSFVIDWFVNMRGLWHIPAAQQLSQERVLDVSYSTKVDYEYHLEYQPLWPFPRTGVGAWSMPNGLSFKGSRGRKTTYERVVGLPVEQGFFTGRDLSAIHTADSVGLIIQKLIK